jgi:hypothetical protein
MNVLIACEFSGVVRDAFRRRGHEAWSCDLSGIEPEGEWPNYHLEGDCRWFMDGKSGPCAKWDLLIAHPPCTYLANSGVRWLYGGKGDAPDPERWASMRESAALFRDMLNAPIERIAVENPVMHGHARKLIDADPAQTIQPWWFGHGETKATCLWLKNLPPLAPTDIVSGRAARVHRASPGPDRWKERSRTLPGIGAAMAEQWGG